jgi:hypothetical protein
MINLLAFVLWLIFLAVSLRWLAEMPPADVLQLCRVFFGF